MHALANNIKFLRQQSHMTQNDLAQALCVSFQAVSGWERGVALPDAYKLCALSRLFGVSSDYLLGLTDGGADAKRMIGIDGGGTKTAFALFDESGRVLRALRLEGCNPNICGLQTAAEVLCRGIDAISRDTRVEGIFAGVAGAATGDNAARLQEMLRRRYPSAAVEVCGDVINIMASATDARRCIAMICGTGSVVFAKDGERVHRVGGWGYLFDDAGSGFDLGRDAVRAALAAHDGIGPPSMLSDLLAHRLGRSVPDALHEIYTRGKDFIASFAPLVFEAYDAGDGAAVRIVQQTAARLGALVRYAHDTYPCGDTVVAAGGLLSRRDILLPLIRAACGADITFIIPDAPPVYGACVSCMALCSHVPEQPFSENFEKTYGAALAAAEGGA